MTAAVFARLLAIFVTVALGWIAGRARWLGTAEADPARVLSNAAFHVFIPALLFRTTARLDWTRMPWRLMAAFFMPLVGFLLVVYLFERRGRRRGNGPIAAPSVRAISATFGNTLQVGVPMAAALFGEAGLGIHVTIVSLHALTLLTVLTVLVETDLARAGPRRAGTPSFGATLRLTLRNTIVHPVVLPVIAGFAWNAAGWPLPAVADEVLLMLQSAVVPLCLVLIGMSLAYGGLPRHWRGPLVLSALKLLALPAVVLVVAHWGFGIAGLPLSVIVMLAALPIGSNALIFSQRYATLESEATAATVLSTLAYAATAPLWLAVLGWIAGGAAKIDG